MAQPLPPGWEAKFDSGTNRYYFINHYTKQTTWVDPRTTYQQQQPAYPQQQQTSYQSSPQQSYQPQPQQQSHQQQQQRTNNVQLQQISPARQESHTQIAETSLSDEVGDDGSELGDNSDMVTPEERRRMVRQMRDALDLVGVSDELVEMALDGVFYKVDMAIDVMKAMGFKKKGENVAVSTSSSSDRWETTTPSRPKRPEQPKKTTAPKTYVPSQPIPSLAKISSQPSTTSSSSSSRTQRNEISFDDLSSKFGEGASSALFKSISPDKGSAVLDKMKSATDMSVQKMFAKSAGSSISSMTSSSTTSNAPTSTKTAKLKGAGANTRLPHGSDQSLLRGRHITTKGADGKLAVGAQRSLAKGPSKSAIGAKTDVRGPDKTLCVGSNPSLAQGPRLGNMICAH